MKVVPAQVFSPGRFYHSGRRDCFYCRLGSGRVLGTLDEFGPDRAAYQQQSDVCQYCLSHYYIMQVVAVITIE